MRFCLPFLVGTVAAFSPSSQRIILSAAADGIDLLTLNFTAAALASIDAICDSSTTGSVTLPNPAAYRTAVHVHAVPNWYRALVPLTGGSPTPAWDLATHLAFINTMNISHSVLSISSPGSVVFDGDEVASVGMARLLNEWLATLVRTYPEYFSFLAVIPLPYTNAAITEAKNAVDKLGAIGLGLLSNHEGYYLGTATFKPFFQAVNSTSKQTVIFIHPNSPCLHFDGQLISADPAVYTPGLVEFFFETGRIVMDLIIMGTLQNFTNIRYQLPHVGGSLPSILDRILSIAPLIPQTDNIYPSFRERVWWDSAGPTFPHQVLGLLGCGVGKEQLVYGTDYPYSQYSYSAALGRMLNSTVLSEEELYAVFRDDAFDLYGKALEHA